MKMKEETFIDILIFSGLILLVSCMALIVFKTI